MRTEKKQKSLKMPMDAELIMQYKRSVEEHRNMVLNTLAEISEATKEISSLSKIKGKDERAAAFAEAGELADVAEHGFARALWYINIIETYSKSIAEISEKKSLKTAMKYRVKAASERAKIIEKYEKTEAEYRKALNSVPKDAKLSVERG